MKSIEPRKQLIKILQANAYRHRLFKVFSDFCELSAISISNAILMNSKREQRYFEIIKQYEKAEIDRFPKMLGLVVKSFENSFFDIDKPLAIPANMDILGSLFMELELGSDRSGQFFTPYHLSYMMAKMSIADLADKVKTKDFITVQEPACGAGSMIIALAQAMLDEKINFQESMHVTAIDIDRLCCHMAYIQFSLLGIPAIVYHGDTLKMEFYEQWETPMHSLGFWNYKLKSRSQDNDEIIKSEPIIEATPDVELPAKETNQQNRQLAFF